MSEKELPRIGQLIEVAANRFKEKDINAAALEARLLMEAASGFSHAELISKSNDQVSDGLNKKFEALLQQREKGVPIFRIFGQKSFFGRDFKLFDDVLEPRPETELLVERILSDWSDKQLYFAEIGVGSGIISISLLLELSGSRAIGTDVSEGALTAARQNALFHSVENNLELVKTDCLAGVQSKFDFVVSNPPYIESGDLKNLQKEVLNFDPQIALDGGEDGLKVYKRIFQSVADKLKPCGKLYLETGHGQHADIIAIAKQMGWGLISKHLDLSGLERMVVFEAKQNRV